MSKRVCGAPVTPTQQKQSGIKLSHAPAKRGNWEETSSIGTKLQLSAVTMNGRKNLQFQRRRSSNLRGKRKELLMIIFVRNNDKPPQQAGCTR